MVSGTYPSLSFNPHPHAEGDKNRTQQAVRRASFNPHPHAEGDEEKSCWQLLLLVSIHTLTRRVTLLALLDKQARKGFNPHPHAEGDCYLAMRISAQRCFNPHPHAEGDWFVADDGETAIVSIHTLTRRVTFCIQGIDPKKDGFNPHPHAEGDSSASRPKNYSPSFNPHPHAEGDLGCHIIVLVTNRVSIHTLTRRVTEPRPVVADTSVFQSTPSRGG